LLKPHGVAVGASGNVYIADTDNHCVRKVDRAGVVSVFAGKCGKSGDNNSANNPKLDKPRTVAVLSQATSTVAGLDRISEFY
jgi:streptogramin lyase